MKMIENIKEEERGRYFKKPPMAVPSQACAE
jgi:hypothetical protein